MKKIFAVAAILLLFLVAFIARENSTGKKIIDTGRYYLEHLSSGEYDYAYALLSDSLAALLSPDVFDYLEDVPITGSIRTGRNESRGLKISAILQEGGARTLWLREGSDNTWRISGDTSIDNLLGSATVLCSSFARATVIPSVTSGELPEGFLCPICGSPYFEEEGRLFCPAGHLGAGLDITGSSCRDKRDSLAAAVQEYISAGYAYPSSFMEMYEMSNGLFGQRGGFHCPDDGYAYYEITIQGVYCPYHEEITIIECQNAEDDTIHAD